MSRRCVALIAALGVLAVPGVAKGQATPGPTQHTTCPTPFKPGAGVTFHGGYAWNVTYHTFPYQFGYAQYSAMPDPATSDDGRATWTNPGAYVECTLTWYYNPNGTVSHIDFRWHIISYRGNITENSGGCDRDADPIYMTSYDPYAPDQEDEAGLQECAGGGGGGSSGGSSTCRWEWMEIEISYDGGQTWHPFWSGWGQVCEEQQS